MDPSENPSAAVARTTLTVEPIIEVPGERAGDMVGRYRLIEKLGEGGMGSVWVAEQREPIDRKVALKVIKLGMDTKQVIARFEAERQALAMMEHPHIAKVLDAGATETGRPFFVMELVNGIPITDYCDRHNLPTPERLELFIQVSYAFEHAHRKGIVHRDIKPQNILVTVEGKAPRPLVIDFGIAKAIGGQRLTEKTVHTALEEFIGTPAYMSPEQAEMNALGIDARSDVYALGVLLYELLTGVTPFKARLKARMSLEEIRRMIREEEPPRPSTSLTTLAEAERANLAKRRQCEPPRLIHLVKGELDWIVMRCLEKDRTQRYQTAEELALDVQRHLKQQPVLAGPPSPIYRLAKAARRHRRGLAIGATMLLLTPLLGILLAVVWPNLIGRKPLSTLQHLAKADALLNKYDREGRIPEALTVLKQALKAEPGDAAIWGKLGWAHWLEYGENESDETRAEAQRCSSNALSINANNAEGHRVQGLLAMNSGDWPGTTNHLLRAEQITRSADGWVLISLASAYQALSQAQQARSYAALAEQAAVERWDVWDRIGRFYYDCASVNRDLQRATSALKRAIELDPDSPLAHRHLGNILMLQKDPEEALKEMRKSLKLRPAAVTLSAIGSVHLVLSQNQAATDFFLQASRADPSKYLYHISAGIALRRLKSPKADEQFLAALRAIQGELAGRENPRTRAYKGLCQAALGQREEASQELAKALDQAGLDMKVLRIIADGYKLLNDPKRAAEVEQIIEKAVN
jgi:serine/threonine protein kinase/lipopolysaccharide biosynthesis regulator YciM